MPVAVAFFVAKYPLSIVELSSSPSIPPLAVDLSLAILSLVGVLGVKYLVTETVSLVILPVAFIDPS